MKAMREIASQRSQLRRDDVDVYLVLVLASIEWTDVEHYDAVCSRPSVVPLLNELADLYVSDADENHDKEISYSKGTRDEVIRRIVGEENFVPFDQAYGQAYMDELHRVRVLEQHRAERDAAGN